MAGVGWGVGFFLFAVHSLPSSLWGFRVGRDDGWICTFSYVDASQDYSRGCQGEGRDAWGRGGVMDWVGKGGGWGDKRRRWRMGVGEGKEMDRESANRNRGNRGGGVCVCVCVCEREREREREK